MRGSFIRWVSVWIRVYAIKYCGPVFHPHCFYNSVLLISSSFSWFAYSYMSTRIVWYPLPMHSTNISLFLHITSSVHSTEPNTSSAAAASAAVVFWCVFLQVALVLFRWFSFPVDLIPDHFTKTTKK